MENWRLPHLWKQPSQVCLKCLLKGNKLCENILFKVVVRWWEGKAILESVCFKVPPCHQTRRDSSWSDRSSGPTSRRRLTTSPHSSPASLRPAGWTESACATGSTRPASRLQKGTCPQIAGRWCPARRASSLGGRRTWRSRPGPPAPCGRGALPCGRRAPSIFWTLLRNPRSCCTPGNICIPSVFPSGNLRSREKAKKAGASSLFDFISTHW